MEDNVKRRETSDTQIAAFSHTACDVNFKTVIVLCGKNELILNF
jgi:hypothetical protein